MHPGIASGEVRPSLATYEVYQVWNHAGLDRAGGRGCGAVRGDAGGLVVGCFISRRCAAFWCGGAGSACGSGSASAADGSRA